MENLKIENDLLKFISQNDTYLQDKDIIISSNIATKFLDMYRKRFPKREILSEQNKNGIIYTFDLSTTYDENNAEEGLIKIFDDLKHNGRYKILAYKYRNHNYKAKVTNTDTILLYETNFEIKDENSK